MPSIGFRDHGQLGAISADRDLVVETRGGTVVEVYSSIPNIRVVLVDWDDARHEQELSGSVFPHTALDEMPEDTAFSYALAASTDESEGR